eukprot:970986-Pleurochrysis_carterae.AAC.4
MGARHASQEHGRLKTRWQASLFRRRWRAPFAGRSRSQGDDGHWNAVQALVSSRRIGTGAGATGAAGKGAAAAESGAAAAESEASRGTPSGLEDCQVLIKIGQGACAQEARSGAVLVPHRVEAFLLVVRDAFVVGGLRTALSYSSDPSAPNLACSTADVRLAESRADK